MQIITAYDREGKTAWNCFHRSAQKNPLQKGLNSVLLVNTLLILVRYIHHHLLLFVRIPNPERSLSIGIFFSISLMWLTLWFKSELKSYKQSETFNVNYCN